MSATDPDPQSKRRFEAASGNGAGRPSAPGDAAATSVAASPIAESGESDPMAGQEESGAGPPGAAGAAGAPGPEPAVTAEQTRRESGRDRGEAFPLDQAPGPAELMPRRRAGKSRAHSGRSRKGRAGKDSAKVLRPKEARGAAREERLEGPAWLAEQARRNRSLPARREGAQDRRGGYVMGTANPCRSCGMAVWLAGKDAAGHWVKVNLDGSPHICGAPMTGLGRYPMPMPLALPPGPQMPPPPAAPYGASAPPPSWPAPQPVADQGRVWAERFMVAVALVALVFLATIPRDVRNVTSGPGDQAVQATAQRAAAPGARSEPLKKDAFSLGSTEDDVMAVMGPPREIYDNRWWYGSSWVDFRNGRVVNFYNSIHSDLKVKMQGVARTTRPTYLAKGLTKDEVLSLQGTPTRLAGSRWYYGSSYVDFREERLADYFNGVLRELKVPARSPSQ